MKYMVRAFDADRLADAVACCAEERRERDAARGLS